MVKINKTAVLTGIGGLVLGFYIGAQRPQLPSGAQLLETVPPTKPYHSLTTQNLVEFGDDVPPRMKAFAEYEGRTIELKLFEYTSNHASFYIPEELKKAGKFNVYAVDRDGNRSQPITLFTLDGIVLKRNPSGSD